MRLADITVEVRDKALQRVGLIRPEDLDLEINDVFNNVGTWTVKLPVEHPLAEVLRTPGAGIVVTGPTDVLISGPVIKPENAATATDPAGTLTIDGVTDSVLLADVLAYPDPAEGDPTKQTAANDQRSGPVETLMHEFVSANIGPSAPAVRRPAGTLLSKVTLGANGARGGITAKSARFPVLGNLLAELVATADLGFRMVQRGSTIVFETFQVQDRSDLIRLDIFHSTLVGHKVATSPPGATRVLVAGQDEGVNRQFVLRTNPTAVAAETLWGRRIEVFKDQRNTDVLAELEQAGDEVLADSGFSTLAVQIVPMEDSAMPYGTTWAMGDRVAVVVEGQEVASTVSGYRLRANSEGFRLGAVLGDASGFDPQAALAKRVNTVENRVTTLEAAGTTPAGMRVIEAGALAGNAPTSAYPSGDTIMYLTPPIETADPSWEITGKWGYVRTAGDGGDDVYQTFTTISPGTTGRTEQWLRSANAASGWSPWRQLAFNDNLRTTGSWTTLTVASGWTAGANAPQYRVVGGVAYLRGEINRGTTVLAMTANTGYTIASGLPAGVAPGQTWFFPVTSAANQPIDCIVSFDGTLSVCAKAVNTATANTWWVSLAGPSWPTE
jgi:hypothetical protein